MTNPIQYKKLPRNPKLKDRARQLRKSGNLSETLLWNQIKNKQFLGLKFNRQIVIGNYIVDFLCKELMIVIEIDGNTHDFKCEYDKKRNSYLKDLGLNVIHILDIDVKKDLVGVVEYLKLEIEGVDRDTPSASRPPLYE